MCVKLQATVRVPGCSKEKNKGDVKRKTGNSVSEEIGESESQGI